MSIQGRMLTAISGWGLLTAVVGAQPVADQREQRQEPDDGYDDHGGVLRCAVAVSPRDPPLGAVADKPNALFANDSLTNTDRQSHWA